MKIKSLVILNQELGQYLDEFWTLISQLLKEWRWELYQSYPSYKREFFIKQFFNICFNEWHPKYFHLEVQMFSKMSCDLRFS